MSSMPTVVVAMSGGVDSSVAAGLLVERGYRVIGMMLRLWSEEGTEDSNRCCTPDAMAQARRIAARLEIPFYAIDVKKPFREIVVESFITGHREGITPNPCLVCNKQIRWGLLYEEARGLGAEYFATGHYVRLQKDDSGWVHLLKGHDHSKDQSYVLSVLTEEHLLHSLFPVGEYTKPEVRDLARKWGFGVAERPDSQDLCFLAGGDYRDFLIRHDPEIIKPGPIVDLEDRILGEHQGLAFFTIGQRKALGIPSSQALYVIAKDFNANRLIVGESKYLGQKNFTVNNMNWLIPKAFLDSFRAEVKIRYKAREVTAQITPKTDKIVDVSLDQPLRDITPGQQAVFYKDDICLGGGAISGIGVTQ